MKKTYTEVRFICEGIKMFAHNTSQNDFNNYPEDIQASIIKLCDYWTNVKNKKE